jgi:hypothetical protein
MGLIRRNSAILPEALNASSNQLVIEKTNSSEPFDLVVRDGKTGFTFFNIEGHGYNYDAAAHLLSIKGGRLLVSKEFAESFGRPSDAGAVAGEISIGATMQPIEITHLDENGDVKSATLPALNQPGLVVMPDVITGSDGLQQLPVVHKWPRGDLLGTDAAIRGPSTWTVCPQRRPSLHSAKSLSNERRRH